MDMTLPHGSRHNSTIRSSNGCWTCRLRRKKCDETRPVCDVCAALHITCHYDQDKPEWMDGGVRQEEMAGRLKHEVKENAHLRREVRAIHVPGELLGATTPESLNSEVEPCPEASAVRLQRGTDCKIVSKDIHDNVSFGRSCTVLITFYVENLLPFLFPFYCPSPLEGGRSWILEMMLSSPVVRQATLCQSSYFFSLAQGTANHDAVWETVLSQTRDAFGVLRQSLQVINGSSITEHLHGAVRIMASVMQMQRFEITVLCFDNCQAHLNAALALFKQLLESPGPVESAGASSNFNAVVNRLGPPTWISPAQDVKVQSAEQAAFRFSSALLIFDDIIASTVLQEKPRLYEYQRCLLSDANGTRPLINLETVVGCQNWVLLQISEISALDAWKKQCKGAGNLDVIDLVRRATAIKDFLETHLIRLEAESSAVAQSGSSLLDAFNVHYYQQSKTSVCQSRLTTRVWAHAALIYLIIVVSGWQPASVEVCYHVGRVIDILTHATSPKALLRTMVWPFCVAGCLAEPAQEAHLREMVVALQPPSVFGTVRKALEIMENVWRNRDASDSASRDLATCFRSQGELVLLV
ncbi:fungal-specific transcription factor domain-containing protein [Daldinia loculata]|uniref:fungal-specific transcription factor domain-containing protein n=1 Tax=Daldinia loculata TaxID=103429 RepID=UPI0020C1F792|nr:fungal-specific transcription factor domain-containing protein [Daldinia loculata]KAI1648984.1 fungal-specific transcription factor domain-containing protein [Daldinia loculata]